MNDLYKSVAIAVVFTLSLSGCANLQQEEKEHAAIAQVMSNDYKGGFVNVTEFPSSTVKRVSD